MPKTKYNNLEERLNSAIDAFAKEWDVSEAEIVGVLAVVMNTRAIGLAAQNAGTSVSVMTTLAIGSDDDEDDDTTEYDDEPDSDDWSLSNISDVA